jgi:hypothetical protein
MVKKGDRDTHYHHDLFHIVADQGISWAALLGDRHAGRRRPCTCRNFEMGRRP